MACSDNVVRAGLTPKFKDVENLCKMLTYLPSTPQERLFPSVTDPGDSCVTVYDPPVPDFAVARIKVNRGIVLIQQGYSLGSVNYMRINSNLGQIGMVYQK